MFDGGEIPFRQQVGVEMRELSLVGRVHVGDEQVRRFVESADGEKQAPVIYAQGHAGALACHHRCPRFRSV